MAQSDYNVNINITTKDNTSKPSKAAAKGMGSLANEAKKVVAAFAVIKAAKVVAELAKVGATAQRQEAALQSLAMAAGTSGEEITQAIQDASQNTISQMDAMAAANKAMVMDVAKSPDEFERLTKVATALGRAMGQDATKSIDDFVTASARQSQMIADNLGLTVTVGQATERYAASLGIAVDELTDAQKKQAFLNMMLEEGEKKMLELGDQTLDSAGKIEQMGAAWENTKAAVGLAVLSIVDMSGALDAIPAYMQNIARATESVSEHGFSIIAWSDAFKAYVRSGGDQTAAIDVFTSRLNAQGEAYNHASSEIERYGSTVAQSAEIGRFNQAAVEQQTTSYTELAYVSDEVKDSLGDQVTSQGLMLHTILQATDAIDGEVVAMDKFASTVDAAAQLSLSIGFTRQAESEKESAARIAVDKEKIESEHLEKMTAIQAKGASRAVRLDVASEQEKLATRQFALDQAQLKVDEMTGKERESAQNAKQQALVVATQKYAEQQKLLEDYSAGRLVIAGQNTDALIAEEERRYQEALRIQALEEAKIAKDQKKAQGQMLIQAVDTWAAQEDLPEGYAEEVAKMRVNIAEEYGMVAEGSAELVTDILGELDAWASGAKVTTGELVGYFGDVIEATDDTQLRLIDLTASEYVIKVRYEMSGQILDPETGQPTKVRKPKKPGEPEEFASGGSFMVGDGGAEMITIQPVGRGENAVYNDTFNVYDGNSMAAVQENRRRQRRGGIARTM